METNLSQWAEFIKKLFCLIFMSKFEKSEIQFKVPLSKVQIFKLKKELTRDEMIFVNNIEGIDLDPHVHFEFLGIPNQGGNKLRVIKNIHVPLVN